MISHFNHWNYGWSGIVFLCLMACGSFEDQATVPKPRMYPRITFPDHQYITLDRIEDCGFSFRRSTHSKIASRSRFFDQDLENDCWFDLNYPTLNASVHFTYYAIDKGNKYSSLTNESFRMAYEHSSIASAIQEDPVIKEGREQGMIFRLKGPVASPYQFYITDTTYHFLRGALYFNSQPNPDSIAPVLDYLLMDMDTLIQSIQWN